MGFRRPDINRPDGGREGDQYGEGPGVIKEANNYAVMASLLTFGCCFFFFVSRYHDRFL